MAKFECGVARCPAVSTEHGHLDQATQEWKPVANNRLALSRAVIKLATEIRRSYDGLSAEQRKVEFVDSARVDEAELTVTSVEAAEIHAVHVFQPGEEQWASFQCGGGPHTGNGQVFSDQSRHAL